MYGMSLLYINNVYTTLHIGLLLPEILVEPQVFTVKETGIAFSNATRTGITAFFKRGTNHVIAQDFQVFNQWLLIYLFHIFESNLNNVNTLNHELIITSSIPFYH